MVSKRIASPDQFRLAMPEPSERDLHRQIADTLRLEIGPPRRLSKRGVVWFASDISNSATATPGARMALGIGSGIPDLCFWFRARTYVQEIKRGRKGVLSEEQALLMAAARLSGTECAICWDAQSCLQNLDVWEIPRERRVIFPSQANPDIEW